MIGEIFTHAFLRNAFLAGTAIAIATGVVGYFVVLRGELFTGDALSHVAFAGPLAFLALGLDAHLGVFVATIGAGLLMGLLGVRGRADDVAIGSTFAWVLGLGVFFLSIYTRSHSTGNGAANVAVLFGSIFGLSAAYARFVALAALLVTAAVLALARPLLFASVDEAVAAARGIPTRALGIGFLGLVGACAALASQAVGALLLLGLLAAPAGAAIRFTARPYRALALSATIAVGSVWAGLVISYAAPRVPPSFAILVVATAIYAGSFVPLPLVARDDS